jgi:hypothetical protein
MSILLNENLRGKPLKLFPVMIVYGDFEVHAILADRMAHFKRRCEELLDSTSLDEVRSLLIEAGQIEQATADLKNLSLEGKQFFQTITDSVAQWFVSIWSKSSETWKWTGISSERFKDFESAITECVFKVPEGFAFYALYPEQYCASALKWLSLVEDSDAKAVVIGIRSIGTTLSSVITAVLQKANRSVHRFTVRPVGPPFERVTSIISSDLRDAKYALIVDEGPGISGSSMASVANSLVDLGFPMEKICFFPGHEGEPGAAASNEIRKMWNQIRRYTSSLEELRWSGQSLEELFLAQSRMLCGRNFHSIKNLSAGQWRKFVCSDEADWPSVCTNFERLKFLCMSESGFSLLWKFAGLGPGFEGDDLGAKAFSDWKSKYEQGWTIKPIGMFMGFVAIPWTSGRQLTIRDAPQISETLGRYLVDSATSPLEPNECRKAIDRLVEIISINIKEAFGSDEASCALALVPHPYRLIHLPSYGDGHLAPHEWIYTEEGQMMKMDCECHAFDHTFVGRQSICWDIAGALIEWKLDPIHKSRLLEIVEEGGIVINEALLLFYQLAYTSFNLGQTTLCMDLTESESERERLKKRKKFYREEFLHLMRQEAVRLT